MAGTNLALKMTDLKAELDALIAYYKAAAAGGLTMEEVYSLVTRAVASFTKLVADRPATAALSADDLKATVLAAFDRLYDSVIAPIDIPYVPNAIETRFVDPMLKKALHTQVAGILDGLLRVFAKGTVPATVPGELAPPAEATPAQPPSVAFEPY